MTKEKRESLEIQQVARIRLLLLLLLLLSSSTRPCGSKGIVGSRLLTDESSLGVVGGETGGADVTKRVEAVLPVGWCGERTVSI
jgi:hypothetical protein